MSCPFCTEKKSRIDLEIRLPQDRIEEDDIYEIEREIKKQFPGESDILSLHTYKCPSCGSRWKFHIEHRNIDPRDFSMGTDWYEIRVERIEQQPGNAEAQF